MDDLKAKLASQEEELKIKNEDADKLIQKVGVETEKVSKEKAIADEEEEKVAKITTEVSKKARDCEEDLAKAEPALIAAQQALNTLNKVSQLSFLFEFQSWFYRTLKMCMLSFSILLLWKHYVQLCYEEMLGWQHNVTFKILYVVSSIPNHKISTLDCSYSNMILWG